MGNRPDFSHREGPAFNEFNGLLGNFDVDKMETWAEVTLKKNKKPKPKENLPDATGSTPPECKWSLKTSKTKNRSDLHCELVMFPGARSVRIYGSVRDF